jgi:hypothetical protein
MAALTTEQPRDYGVEPTPLDNHLPMTAIKIFAGAAVSRASTGDVRGLNIADEGFEGFARQTFDNSAGSAGGEKVKVRQRGIVILDVVGVTDDSDVADSVYASDEDVFTLTAGSNLLVGKVRRWISGTTCEVYFEALSVRSI